MENEMLLLEMFSWMLQTRLNKCAEIDKFLLRRIVMEERNT